MGKVDSVALAIVGFMAGSLAFFAIGVGAIRLLGFWPQPWPVAIVIALALAGTFAYLVVRYKDAPDGSGWKYQALISITALLPVALVFFGLSTLWPNASIAKSFPGALGFASALLLPRVVIVGLIELRKRAAETPDSSDRTS